MSTSAAAVELCPGKKTFNTSTKPTTTRSWIVNDLLGVLLLEQGERQDGRHFHQLFRHLRMTKIAVHQTLPNAVLIDLGHFDDLRGHLDVQPPTDFQKMFPPSAATGISRTWTMGAASASWSTVRRRTLSTTFGGSGSFRTPGRLPPELAVFCARRPKCVPSPT